MRDNASDIKIIIVITWYRPCKLHRPLGGGGHGLQIRKTRMVIGKTLGIDFAASARKRNSTTNRP